MQKRTKPTLLFVAPEKASGLAWRMLDALRTLGHERANELTVQYQNAAAHERIALRAEISDALNECCDNSILYFGQNPRNPAEWGFWPHAWCYPRRLIVSRHPAAIEFVRSQPGWEDAPVVATATAQDVKDAAVAGNLPLHLAAQAAVIYAVEFAGGPPRGQEYSLEEMKAAGAVLRRYGVIAL